MMKRFKYFIGIDVSKLTLDIALMDVNKLVFHQKIKNELENIEAMISQLKEVDGFRLSNAVFGMEQTGIYCNKLLTALQKKKASIVCENPTHIKNSLGEIRGKTDKLDSIRIASYLRRSKDELRLWQGRRKIIQELSSLATLRDRLSQTILTFKTPLKEDKLFIDNKLAIQNIAYCARSIQALQEDIESLDNNIVLLWSADGKINRLMEIITSIPCIGNITALKIIITTNEFETITSAKQYAAYAGVAPFPMQSGTALLKRNRVSQIANKKIKSLLHTCAMLSTRFVPEIKDYYKRKTEIEGKPKMLVLNAIRSKLILRVFSCVKEDRFYEKDYRLDIESQIGNDR